MNTDIAIVGGGIGGLYMGCKLQAMGYKSWAIFEASQRVGGKIHSNVYSDTNGNALYCEWGAMRFEWGCQPYLEKLITELDVELVDFPPFCGDRGWELELIEKICASLWKIFLDFHTVSYKKGLWNYLRQDNNREYLANDLNPHKVMHQLTSLNYSSLAILGDSFSFDNGFIEGVLTSCPVKYIKMHL